MHSGSDPLLPPLRSVLYDEFIRTATPEQIERFEHWKRSKFPRAAMKRLMGEVLGSSTEKGAIILVRCIRALHVHVLMVHAAVHTRPY